MAKGQMKGNKEAKKPKADKPKTGGSAYKVVAERGRPGHHSADEKEVAIGAGEVSAEMTSRPLFW